MTLDPVPTMGRAARDLWVAALRDEDTYPQAKGALRNEDGYCCLGVLCEVAIKAGVDVTTHLNDDNVTSYDGNIEHLPDSVVVWAGLQSENPVVIIDDPYGDDGEQREVELTHVNDDLTWSFAAIADIVEAQL